MDNEVFAEQEDWGEMRKIRIPGLDVLADLPEAIPLLDGLLCCKVE